jgi:hypothetical protein
LGAFFILANVRRYQFIFSLIALLNVTGCFNVNSAYFRTIKYAFSDDSKPIDVPDSIRKQGYLSVLINDKVRSLLVLGYSKVTEIGEEQIWYSGSGETVHLLNGLIVKTVGLPVDWREASYSLSKNILNDISFLLSNQVESVNFSFKKNQMPGYFYSVQKDYVLRMQSASNDFPVLSKRTGLNWFVAKPTKSSADHEDFFYIGVDVASGKNKIIVTRQCLDKSICLELEYMAGDEMAGILKE